MFFFRIDVDCLTIKHQRDNHDVHSLFENSLFTYKKENQTDIVNITNFTKGSYRIKFDDGKIVHKIPGTNMQVCPIGQKPPIVHCQLF